VNILNILIIPLAVILADRWMRCSWIQRGSFYELDER